MKIYDNDIVHSNKELSLSTGFAIRKAAKQWYEGAQSASVVVEGRMSTEWRDIPSTEPLTSPLSTRDDDGDEDDDGRRKQNKNGEKQVWEAELRDAVGFRVLVNYE